MDRLRRWWTRDPATVWLVALITVFVAVALGPALLGFRTLISVNLLTQYFPWRAGGTAAAGHETCTGDTIDTVMPQISFVRNQWWHGHLGSWQPFTSGGSPLGAVPNVGQADPLSLPYLVLPLWLAPAFVKLLELLVGGGGTYLFLRRLGVSRPAGLLAGAVFGTTGFMVMWSNWPQTRVAALIPALFWAAERLAQQLRLRDAALLALVGASMVLGGFPAVTAWALEVAGLYFLVRLYVLYRGQLASALRGVVLAVTGLVTAGLLASFELLPFAHVYSQTQDVRGNYGLTPLNTFRLVTLIDPGAYGLCVAGDRPVDGSSPVENVAFVGAAAIVLALIGACVRLRRVADEDVPLPGSDDEQRRGITGRGVTMFFTVAAVAVMVIGWSDTTVLRHLQWLPPFHGNPVGRIRSVLGFLLAVLAGVGYDTLLARRSGTHRDPRPRPDRTWIRPAVIGGGGVAFGAWLLYEVHKNGISAHVWAAIKPTLYIPALIVLGTVVLLALAATGREWARWPAVFVVPLLVLAQGGYFFHHVLPGDDPDNFYPHTATQSFLAQNLGHDRYDATAQVTYPSTALYYRLRTATGHVVSSKEWLRLLRAVDPAVSLTPTFTAFSNAMTPAAVANSPILDRLGVRYWVFGPGTVVGTRAELQPASGSVPVSGSTAASCRLDGGPIRGVTVQTASPLSLVSPAHPGAITVESTNGTRDVRSALPLLGNVPAGQKITLPIPGDEFGAGATTVRVTLSGVAGTAQLAGTSGSAACAAVTPAADHLRLVAASAGTTIYERLTALPRIRWSGSAQVLPTDDARVAALAAGVPANTVVLPAAAGEGGGGNAAVAVQGDVPGTVRVHVTAETAGYLTVADAMTSRGWEVTVDGKAAPLLTGDEAMGTVAVPAGDHVVAFSYHAPGLDAGIALSGVGVLALAALVLAEPLRRRRRRRR